LVFLYWVTTLYTITKKYILKQSNFPNKKSMSMSNKPTTYQKLRAEVEAIQQAMHPSATMLWTYPYVPEYHITDSITQVDGNPAIDPECILHTTVENYSAIRYRIWFMRQYKVAEGILHRPIWRGSHSAIWYNSPPDETFEILFEGNNRLEGTMEVKNKMYLEENLSERVVVCPTAPHVWLHYEDISAEMWIDWRLYARLSRNTIAVRGHIQGVPDTANLHEGVADIHPDDYAVVDLMDS